MDTYEIKNLTYIIMMGGIQSAAIHAALIVGIACMSIALELAIHRAALRVIATNTVI